LFLPARTHGRENTRSGEEVNAPMKRRPGFHRGAKSKG
jgi:hypothetical protein